MEYYSKLKRNELSSHEKTWRKLKYILLSEGSQSDYITIWKTQMKSLKRSLVASCCQGQV